MGKGGNKGIGYGETAIFTRYCLVQFSSLYWYISAKELVFLYNIYFVRLCFL